MVHADLVADVVLRSLRPRTSLPACGGGLWEELAHATATREIRDLQEALAGRNTIAQAVGVIRGLYACDEDTAFSVVARLRQVTDMESVDVAASILATASAGGMPEDLAELLQASTQQAPSPRLRA